MTTELPSRWSLATAAELATLVRGVTFKKSEALRQPAAGLVPIVRAGNVQDGRIRVDEDLVYVPTERIAPEQYLRSGDTLIATSSGSLSVVGKSAPVRNDWIGAHGAFMAVLRPHAGIRPAYLSYFLQSDRVRRLWRNAAAGTNINNLKRNDLLSTEIPVCPLGEQERIVAGIEEHFSRLDAVDASLEAADLRSQALVKSLLVGAIPNELPPCWRMTTVDKVGETGLGRQRSPKYHSGPNMKPYLRVANVFEDRIDASDIMEMHFEDADFDKYRLEVGDVLLNEGQSPEFLGRPAIYCGDPPSVAFTNSLIRFVAGPDVTPEWALLVFRRHMHAGRFMKESRITTNIAHLALGRLRSVEFPVPPLEVQDALVAATRAALGSVDRTMEQIRSAATRTTALRRAVLNEAFAGRLVSRDRGLEPVA